MFGRKGSSKPQSRIDCLIGAGTTIEGDITFTGGLRVDGACAETWWRATAIRHARALGAGRIEGEVRVSHVVINGTLVGPIYSGGVIELQPKANVTGDVYYKSPRDATRRGGAGQTGLPEREQVRQGGPVQTRSR